MKVKYLPVSGKAVWQNNKPFLFFLFGLLFLFSVLKIAFYNYNYSLLFNGAAEINSGYEKFKLVKWSLLNDLLTILFINLPFLFLLQLSRFINIKLAYWFILPLFFLLNSFAILLNLVDIFYFPFHFQRANADLWYVLDHPFRQLFHFRIFIIIVFVIAIAGILVLIWKLHKKLLAAFSKGHHGNLVTIILFICIILAFVYKNSFTKLLVPTYPLVDIKSRQLPVVQNSFHSFSYSAFRKGEEVQLKHYMPVAACDSIFPIKKILQSNSGSKNIVLFIMESVPYDFFDPASAYKVQMPFFDSLLERSTFYKNAFCYAHESNKGLVAILAGIPTLTDIPVYHSSFINMPVTPIGTALKKKNYHSFFCIGDEFDNFGFAKCMNWLGIDKYYSKEDIPGYKNKPSHPMGLQDEVVLDFMHQKIKQVPQPFFAINYNISTHYPYDLPASFTEDFPGNYTPPMKSMRYYDRCLQKFFSASKTESWFANTIFIFCSDHWMFPQGIKGTYNAVSSYRIPIIIYDPSVNEKKISEQLASQFDIPGSILSAAGYRDSIISYGKNLFDSNAVNNYVFSKPGSSLYQVTDSAYVLGFNIANDKAEYLYHYKKDPLLLENLLLNKGAVNVLNSLSLQVKAFIQKAGTHYNSRPVK